MDSSSSYNDIVKNIDSKVSTITSSEPSPVQVSSTSSIKGIDNRLIYGGLLFVAVVVGLYMLKPTFILEEVSIDGEMPSKKMSYKKLLMWATGVTAVLGGGAYYYFYIRKPSSSS